MGLDSSPQCTDEERKVIHFNIVLHSVRLSANKGGSSHEPSASPTRRAMKKLFLCALLGLSVSCASAGSSRREILRTALKGFIERAPAPGRVWLTNESDSACDRVGAGPNASSPRMSSSTADDLLAFEVFSNVIVSSKWAPLIESHRHNYVTELSPVTHQPVRSNTETTTSVEDLCLLDEAKKRHAEAILVYEIVGSARDALLVHFRLSNARTGIVQSSATLLASPNGIEDRSQR
jgi:hypothetical protein